MVEFIHKYDIHQSKVRAAAVSNTAKNLKFKFLKVLKAYRIYKKKKDDKLRLEMSPSRKVKFSYEDDKDIKENEFHIGILNDDINEFFEEVGEKALLNRHKKILEKQE